MSGGHLQAVSEPFEQAKASIRKVQLRQDLVVGEIPSPTEVAPYSIALAGDVRQKVHGEDSVLVRRLRR